jgi:hypothetical protein
MVAYALAALVKRPNAAGAAKPRLAPEQVVLRAVLRELEQVRRQRQADGWTGDLAARGLAALRIAGAYAMGRPVAHVPVRAGASPMIGQVRVAPLWPRRRGALVSGSATAEALEQHGVSNPDLHGALQRFATAAYGRNGIESEGDLDDALDQGMRGVRHVARNYTWSARAARALRQSMLGMRDRAWAR